MNGFRSHDTALAMAGDFGFTGSAFTGKRYGTGIDTQINLGVFDLSTEWLDVRFNPANRAPATEFDAAAWYIQGSYFVVPKQLRLALRYDTFDPNDNRVANETHTWTLGVNWLLKGDDLKLQLNYNLVDVPAPLLRQKQIVLRSQVIF